MNNSGSLDIVFEFEVDWIVGCWLGEIFEKVKFWVLFEMHEVLELFDWHLHQFAVLDDAWKGFDLGQLFFSELSKMRLILQNP